MRQKSKGRGTRFDYGSPEHLERVIRPQSVQHGFGGDCYRKLRCRRCDQHKPQKGGSRVNGAFVCGDCKVKK